MKWITKDKSHVDRGTATLRNAVDNAKREPEWYKLAEASDSRWLYCQETMNCTSVQSELIEYVGRYTERFGSDLLCTFMDLDAFLGRDASEEDPYGRWIIGVGIREDGVDSNSGIMYHLRNTKHGYYLHPQYVYRKVLAIDIEDELVPDSSDQTYYRNRNITLYDITNCLYKLAEEDE